MIPGNGTEQVLTKPENLSNPKQKPFFAVQDNNRFIDGTRDVHEIKQSKSNGSLGKSQMSTLKKNVSFDKMLSKAVASDASNPIAANLQTISIKAPLNTANNSFQVPSNRLLVSKESTPKKLFEKMKEAKYTGLQIGTQELRPSSIRLSETYAIPHNIPKSPKSFSKVVHANKSTRSKSKQTNQSQALEDYKEVLIGRLSTGETNFIMGSDEHDWPRSTEGKGRRSPFKTADETVYQAPTKQLGSNLPSKFSTGKTNSDYIFGHPTPQHVGTSRLTGHRIDDAQKRELNYLTGNKSSQNILNFHGIHRHDTKFTGLTSKYGRSTGGNRFPPDGSGKVFPSFTSSGSANILSSYSKKSGQKLRDISVERVITQNNNKEKNFRDTNLISEALAGLSPSAKTSSTKQHVAEGTKKRPTNSNTASTLKTVSTVNHEDIKQGELGSEQLLASQLAKYEMDGEELEIVHLVENYESRQLFSIVSSGSGLTDAADFAIQYQILRGHTCQESTEQKFYLPKSSIISVTGVVGLDLLQGSQLPGQEGISSSSQILLDEMRNSVGPEQDLTSSRRRGSAPNYRNSVTHEPFCYLVEEIQYNHDQTVISQGGLDTPSFTVPGESGSLAGKVLAKSDDFTFGKASVEESINPRANESLVSSMIANDRNESFHGSFEPLRKEGLKTHTQRSLAGEYLRGAVETQSNREVSPKPHSHILGRNGLPHLRPEIFGKPATPNLEIPRQYLTSRHTKPKGESGNIGNNSVDYGYMNRASETRVQHQHSEEVHSERHNQTMDSCDDSERFNLYRNGPAGSDTDEAEFAYDVGGYPLSDRDSFLAGSSMRSDQPRKTIYSSRIEEIPVQLDASQFFLDDEVRSKYESLLQTTSKK